MKPHKNIKPLIAIVFGLSLMDGGTLLAAGPSYNSPIVSTAIAVSEISPSPQLALPCAGNTLTSTDTPKLIPDLTQITSLISSCNTGSIRDLNVQINITHTWDSDLDIFLIAPNGTRIELATDVGGESNNFTDTIFDDEAATAITAGTAPFTGSYRPEGPLSVLDNLSAEGDWTLEITDDAGDDVGTLNSWSLIFTTDPKFSWPLFLPAITNKP
jgi:subtilisin-like proprotein convertase family protein